MAESETASSRPGSAVARLRRHRAAGLVFLVATILSLLITAPLLLHFADEIYGTPGDASGAVTQYWWWGYALTHGRSVFDISLEGVPVGSEWSQIPFVVLPLLVIPGLSILVGPIASYNLLILSSFPLTAWAVYLLARRLDLEAVPSALAGLAFAFAPYHIEKAQGHGNETHMEFIALAFYFLVRWRQSGRLSLAAVAGVMTGLQLWMDYSLTLVLAFGLLAFFAVNVVLRARTISWPAWLGLNLGAGLILMLVVAFFVPLMLLAAHRPGEDSYANSFGGALQVVNRSFTELVVYSARLHEYVEPWHANPLLPGRVREWEQVRLHGSNWTESSLFIGYTVIALAIWGLVDRPRKFRTGLGLALIGIGAAMAEPPVVHLLGREVHAPSYYLFQVITFFRVYARFAILVLLGAGLLAGQGLAALQARAGKRWPVLLAPFFILALEFNNIPPTHLTRILPAPAEYTWLRDQPPGILLEYPAQSGPAPVLEVQIRQYELYQMVHLHPTFLNEVTQSGRVARAAAELEPYYKPGVATRLRGYGVRYVFVHRADYLRAGWIVPDDVGGLTHVASFGDVEVYTVD